MVNLKIIDAVDVFSNEDALSYMVSVFEETPFVCGEYEYKGKKKLVCIMDSGCVIFPEDYKIEDETARNVVFDENYNVTHFDDGDYVVDLQYGVPIYTGGLDPNKDIGINVIKRDEPDTDGYNGVILFNQADSVTGEELLITYQINVSDDSRNKIYGVNLLRPNSYVFTMPGLFKKKTRRYMRYNIDSNDLFYDGVALQDFGLVEFIKNGSYSLIKENSVVRYLNSPFIMRDGRTRTDFPFSKALKEEEIKYLVLSKGFLAEVPEIVYKFYNDRTCPEYEEGLEVVAAIKKVLGDNKDFSEEQKILVKINNE